MTYIGNKEYRFEVAKGNVADHGLVSIFGYNPDVDIAAAEDIWTQGGDYVPPTQARIHDLVSDSANDDSGGTGANTVRVTGISSDGDEIMEDVTMDGTTNVATSLSYLAINELVVKTAGTGLTNAGTITATAQTDATVSASIAPGVGISSSTVYRVPRGKTLYLDNFHVWVSTVDSTSSEGEVGLFAMPAGGAWNLVGRLSIAANNMEKESYPYQYARKFDAGTTLKARVLSVSADNVDVSAHLVGVVVQGTIPATGGAAILRENGGYLLREDGGVILREN